MEKRILTGLPNQYKENPNVRFCPCPSSTNALGAFLEKYHFANVSEKGLDGWTPLRFAIYEENLAVAKLLVAANANIESETKAEQSDTFHFVGESIFAGACRMHGNPEVLRFLLDNKADMMKRTTGMEKALPVELCAVSGNAAGMAAMLSYGHPLQCDVDSFGNDIMHMAGNAAGMAAMLDYGHPIQCDVDSFGNDFMHGACFCGSVEIARMLVHRGFPPKANGWALCHLSAAALGPAPVEMTKLLLESCEEIRAAKNMQSGEGATGIAWMILTGCQAANFVSNDRFFAFMSPHWLPGCELRFK